MDGPRATKCRRNQGFLAKRNICASRIFQRPATPCESAKLAAEKVYVLYTGKIRMGSLAPLSERGRSPDKPRNLRRSKSGGVGYGVVPIPKLVPTKRLTPHVFLSSNPSGVVPRKRHVYLKPLLSLPSLSVSRNRGTSMPNRFVSNA